MATTVSSSSTSSSSSSSSTDSPSTTPKPLTLINNERCILLNNGNHLPTVGFGTWRCDIDKLEEAVYTAIKLGYRHIDAANLYKNEHITGKAIQRAITDGLVKRDDLFVTSKLAPTQMEPHMVRPMIEKSIADLCVGYLDLYITHWPYAIDSACTVSPAPTSARLGYDKVRYMQVWQELEKAVTDGLVRNLGCSNMTAMKLHDVLETCKIKPSVVQNELHPCLNQSLLKQYCDYHGIVLTAYCPLGSPGRPAAYRNPGDPEILTQPIILEISNKMGKTPAQVALRWALQRGTVPLPRSTNTERITENFGIYDWSLSNEDMEKINSLDLTVNSKGRIMKGDNFQIDNLPWQGVWDEEWMVINVPQLISKK